MFKSQGFKSTRHLTLFKKKLQIIIYNRLYQVLHNRHRLCYFVLCISSHRYLRYLIHTYFFFLV